MRGARRRLSDAEGWVAVAEVAGRQPAGRQMCKGQLQANVQGTAAAWCLVCRNSCSLPDQKTHVISRGPTDIGELSCRQPRLCQAPPPHRQAGYQPALHLCIACMPLPAACGRPSICLWMPSHMNAPAGVPQAVCGTRGHAEPPRVPLELPAQGGACSGGRRGSRHPQQAAVQLLCAARDCVPEREGGRGCGAVR